MSFLMLDGFDPGEGNERQRRVKVGTFSLGRLRLAVDGDDVDRMADLIELDGAGFGKRWNGWVVRAVLCSRSVQQWIWNTPEGWSSELVLEDIDAWPAHLQGADAEKDRALADRSVELLPFLRAPDAQLVAAKVYLKTRPKLFLLLRHKPDGSQVITLEGLETTQVIGPAKDTVAGVRLLRRIAQAGRPLLEESAGHPWREIAEKAERLKREEPSLSLAHIAARLYVTEDTEALHQVTRLDRLISVRFCP